MLIDAVVASVQLAAREPSHVPGVEAPLANTVEVSEPLQGRPGRVAPELVGLLEALLVHRLLCVMFYDGEHVRAGSTHRPGMNYNTAVGSISYTKYKTGNPDTVYNSPYETTPMAEVEGLRTRRRVGQAQPFCHYCCRIISWMRTRCPQ